MRIHEYSLGELDFLSRLAFYDVKQVELRKRAGEEVGNQIWSGIEKELGEEFELNLRENSYVWRCVSKFYEEDPQLVSPRTRFEKRGLPFD